MPPLLLSSLNWPTLFDTEDGEVTHEQVAKLLFRRRRLPWTFQDVEVDSRVEPAWFEDMKQYIMHGLTPAERLTLFTYTTQDFTVVQDFLHGGDQYKTLVVLDDVSTAPTGQWARDPVLALWKRTPDALTCSYGVPKKLATRILRHEATRDQHTTHDASDRWHDEWERLLAEVHPHLNATFWREAHQAYVRDAWTWRCQYVHQARVLRPAHLRAPHAHVLKHKSTPWARFKACLPYITADGWRAILAQLVTDLDGIFAGAPPLPAPLVVYRGSKRKTRRKTPGYISTALTEASAAQFVDAQSQCCVFRLQVPKGARVLPVCMVTRYVHELEVLLPRGLLKS